jgi:uncharacterized delta-60 repeat protein
MTHSVTSLRRHRVMRRLGLPAALVLIPLVALLAPAALGAEGDLDPSFSGDGTVITDFGGFDTARSVAVQVDGRIVVAGDGVGFELARYTRDGTLDGSFSGDGKQVTDFGGGTNGASGVAVQGDGKLVAAGYAWVGSTPGNQDFALVRYLPNGDLDTSFSGDGKQTTDFSGNHDFGQALALEPDGKIVVAGDTHSSGPADFALVRYLPNGDLDTSFSGDGRLTTDFGGYDSGAAVALQPDGKIVVAGGSDTSFAVARYDADGSPDPSFSGDGKVTTGFTDPAAGRAVAVQADGKILVAGGEGGAVALARYTPDGALDPSFGTGGRVATAVPDGVVSGYAVALQGDGKLVVGAINTPTSGPRAFMIARYLTSGIPDGSFSGDGMTTTGFGGYNGAFAVAIQGDGAILAAGAADGDFGVARYLGPASPKPADRSVTIQLQGRKVRLHGRRAAVKLSCPVSEASPPCTGTLTLSTAKKIPLGHHRVRVVLADRGFSIGAGVIQAVKLHLSTKKAALVRSVPKARRVKAVVEVQDAAGNHATVVVRLKLVLPPR